MRIDDEFRSLIPAPTEEELAGLEESIVREGCRDALVVWHPDDGDDLLLDGHNRLAICLRHKISYKIERLHLASRDDAMIWIIRNQFYRRNLTPYQRAELALTLEPLIAARAKAKQSEAGKLHQISDEAPVNTLHEVASAAGVSHDTIHKARVIRDRADEKAKARLRSGETSINREYVRLRRSIIRDEVLAKQPDMPTGRFRVLYADPPWSYGNTQPDYHPEQADHYPTMTMQELEAFPMQDISEENAVLFLWATSPILPEALALAKAWGFTYKSSFVWDKVKHNMGHYNSVRHEFLLVCVRGSCQPDVLKLFDSVQTIERTEHSVKPEVFRNIIDTIYPKGNRIELFARKQHQGWEVYGNQVSS